MAVPGVYIAHHPWLDLAHGAGNLHKVGHTGDLRARLNDSAYVTCFPEGWKYLHTFELKTKEDAFLLETAILHCCRHLRIDGRELVKMRADEILTLGVQAAKVLDLKPNVRRLPVYPVVARSTNRAQPQDQQVEPTEPTGWAKAKAAIDQLTVSSDESASNELDIRVTRHGGGEDLSQAIDEVLAWDFTELANTLPVLVPPSPSSAFSPPLAGPATPTKALPVTDEIDELEVADLAVDDSSPFDIRGLDRLALRDYQQAAITGAVAELRANQRAILQMACRCGKTPVAFGVLRELLRLGVRDSESLERPVCALYLVPGLALLRQTAQKLVAYGFTEPILLVGSDARPVDVVSQVGARSLQMTTDPAVVRSFVSERGRRLVVSTYQSSPQVPTDAFALTVFDECHRVCGGRAARPFNAHVLAERKGMRLFMTATPAYDAVTKATISMKDRELFGGVAYRYHLRQGIGAGFVNDFRLEMIAAPVAGPTSGGTELAQETEEQGALPQQIATAMGKVDKLLVFCRDIKHATRLCEAVRAMTLPADVKPFEVLVAHSKMGPGGASQALKQLAAPGGRACLFNCRLFQEGVEVPTLNAVFFAAPRHSPRDIIQSVCRPLNRADGKPASVVFLPLTFDPKLAADDPQNLARYASVVPFVDALLDEDPRLYEHLLDPETPYPLGVVGVNGTTALSDARRRAMVLAGVRRAVRYGTGASMKVERLMRTEKIPWDRAFAEIQRVVRTNNRYPKTTDAWLVGTAKVNLHRIYRWAADEYLEWKAGRVSKLEPHQINDLLSLKSFDLYGSNGPYPDKECSEYLDQYLTEHGVDPPPMIALTCGGYIGLDATAMERLSGWCTLFSQGDGKDRANGKPGSGFTINAHKQKLMDDIAAKHGIRWRKERDAEGRLVEGGPKTFFQLANEHFKTYLKAHGNEAELVQQLYPLWPRKHKLMESPETLENNNAPPRMRTSKRREALEKQIAAERKGKTHTGCTQT